MLRSSKAPIRRATDPPAVEGDAAIAENGFPDNNEDAEDAVPRLGVTLDARTSLRGVFGADARAASRCFATQPWTSS